MKNRRQMLILDIISRKYIETQEELADELRALGVKVTQATVSRDIKDLRLIKTVNPDGKNCYSVGKNEAQEISDRQLRIFTDSVVSVRMSLNMVVLKTITGTADAAAETLDGFKWSEVIGTIAGDNTIFIVTEGEEASRTVVDRLNQYLR